VSVNDYWVDTSANTIYLVTDATGGTFAVVPEPGTISIVLSGLIGLVAYAWRKRK